MSKQSFAPKSDHKRDLWLKNFAGKLPTYGAKYGLNVEENAGWCRIPDYTDTATLPAAGESAFWKYRGMYRFDDEQVGQWSVTDGLTVTG